MDSPKASLLHQIVTRLKEKAPSLRYIARDVKQLEAYQMRPAVTWPCCLITLEKAQYTNLQNDTTQIAKGTVTCRIGLVQYTDTNNLTNDTILQSSLNYYNIEQEVYQALHGWAPDGFNKMLRISDGPEIRDDDILVVVIEFSIGYTDETAKATKTTITRPVPMVGN